MQFTDKVPEHFPGKEFCLEGGEPDQPEYIYEINRLRIGKTTSGSQLVIPSIEYRALAWVDASFWKSPYTDSVSGKIGEDLLNEGQLCAIQVATGIEQKIRSHDPELNTFASMREIKLDSNGLLYVTSTEEGSKLQGNEPFAAVRYAKSLGVVDFATTVRGYYGFFKYDKADLDAFIPDALIGTANAYAWIDEPRIVTDSCGDYNYQLARMMLFQVDTDLDFPVESINTSVPEIAIEYVEK